MGDVERKGTPDMSRLDRVLMMAAFVALTFAVVLGCVAMLMSFA